MVTWKFNESKNLAVFTTKSVVKNNKAILFVYHDKDDGDWQFHHDVEPKEEDSMIIALSEIIEIDESINQLANLPLGWKAHRETKDSEWKLFED